MVIADTEGQVVAKLNKVMDCADDNADDNIMFQKKLRWCNRTETDTYQLPQLETTFTHNTT